MLNSDWWNQSNQDFQATESQKQRDWQSAEAEKERAFTASENAKNRAVKGSGGGSGGGGGFTFDFNGDGVTDSADVLKAMDSKGVKSFQGAIMNETEFRRRGHTQKERYDTYDQYVMAKIEEWSNKKAITEYETEFLLGYYFSN
jgi:hypothetical protein